MRVPQDPLLLPGKRCPVTGPGGDAMPLLLADTGAGWVLRAPCGAETAVLFTATAGTAAPVVRAARQLAIRNPSLRADVSPAAVMQLALHCARCVPCQTRRFELLHLMAAAGAAASPGRPALT